MRLTNEPVLTAADAWRVIFAYARRWQIEMSFRYGKSELSMESPRLWRWESRLKLLGMATLVYAFLLTLLQPSQALLRQWLLRWWCHRNGKQKRQAEPRSLSSALPLAFGYQPLMVCLPSTFISPPLPMKIRDDSCFVQRLGSKVTLYSD